MADRGDRYVIRHIPLVVLDPSSSSDDDTVENVPQTPPHDIAPPVPAPPASPPPLIPPPPQSPPVSHSGSSDHHPVMRSPVRLPTVSDDSEDSDRPAFDQTRTAPSRGRPRTRATARKSIGYRPSRPLAPRDLFPHSTFEVGSSSRQPDYSDQIHELTSDVERIHTTVRETRWAIQGTQITQQEMADQMGDLHRSGQEWRKKIEDRVQGYSDTVTQYHTQTLFQIDRLQQMLIVAAVVAMLAVFMMLLPQFLG